PFQFAEQTHILGEEIVLDNSPILRLILADNGVITIIKHLSALSGFAPFHIERTLVFNDLSRDAQADHLIDLPLTSPVELIISVLTDNVVAKEFGCARSRVGDERLLLGEFQFKRVA